MLVSAVRPPIVDTILEGYEMRVYQIPEINDLFDQDHAFYSYEKTFDEARSEPLMILHTSETTDFPKSVI